MKVIIYHYKIKINKYINRNSTSQVKFDLFVNDKFFLKFCDIIYFGLCSYIVTFVLFHQGAAGQPGDNGAPGRPGAKGLQGPLVGTHSASKQRRVSLKTTSLS